ncbi:MAG: hypothetical protein ACK5GV_03360 [Bacteroidota bacterium]|jgi:hypothetical protein
MRLIDRLEKFLRANRVTAYAFEHTCGLSNGYLAKQLRGRGSVGSDIIEKIKYNYPELSIVWLFTGKGQMQLAPQATGLENISIELREEQALFYTAKDDVIAVLKKQIEQYQSALAEKDKIIRLLENRQPLRR